MTKMHTVTGDEELPIAVPPLTRGWRMQMAMDYGNRTRDDMALACGVARSTISRWLHDVGKRQPRRGDMQIWAEECRVPLGWLAPDMVDDDEPPFSQPTVPYLRPDLKVLTGGADHSPQRALLLAVGR